jgi:hypothetical protein
MPALTQRRAWARRRQGEPGAGCTAGDKDGGHGGGAGFRGQGTTGAEWSSIPIRGEMCNP